MSAKRLFDARHKKVVASDIKLATTLVGAGRVELPASWTRIAPGYYFTCFSAVLSSVLCVSRTYLVHIVVPFSPVIFPVWVKVWVKALEGV